MGVFVGVWIAASAAPTWLEIPLRATDFVAFLEGFRRYNDRRGVMPRLRSAPGSIQHAMGWYLVFVAAMVAGLGALWPVAPWWVIAPVGAVLAWLGTAIYDRRYAIAARQSELAAGIAPDAIAGGSELRGSAK